MNHRFAVLAVASCALACASSSGSSSPIAAARHAQDGEGSAARGWDAPALEHAVSVRDGRTGERLTLAAMLDRLAQADAVFVGETHTDETTHRVELAVFEGLLARREGNVVLAMEMFERDVQEQLDAYLAGEIDEAAFRASARPWSNYQTAYRPLIERAKKSGAPVVASNFPASLRRRVFAEGAAALEGLEGDERRLAPAELMPNTPEYWRRVDNAIRGHLGMMPMPEPGDQRLMSTQTLWDNSMGEACALALDDHPGSSVVHVNGGFHSAYFDGTVRQFRLRKPDAKVLTVAVEPTANPAVAEWGGKAIADFVVFAEERAVDYDDGLLSVYTHRKQGFRLHVPEGAQAGAEVPLLIWLPDEGLASEDGLALWKERLGDEAAIAVLEAPYRQIQFDLIEGGRWTWPDTFLLDVGALAGTVYDVWAFVSRYYPIDPTRTAVAGEGAGATIVATTALFDDTLLGNYVAFRPADYRQVKDIPLPLPELRADEQAPPRTLRVFAEASSADFWTSEVAQYATVGFDATVAEASAGDAWTAAEEDERAVRTALGLDAVERATSDARRHLVVDGDSERARYWARLHANRHTLATGERVAVLAPGDAASGSEALPVSVSAASFGEGGDARLPRCPGAFGGTTVVVVPAGASEDERAAWLALEESDPIQAASRFHRLRVADEEGERSLAAVLTTLEGENRKNVLVVPATFCADGMTMQRLRGSVRDLEDRMTLQWMPGLGRQ